MKISKDVVRNVAELAQLQVSEAEIPGLIEDMTRILDLADAMQGVDTEGTEPLANPLDATQRLRPDTVTETDQHEHFQQLTPHVADDLYLVPRVVE